MRLLALAFVLVPSVAAATPITIGASLGVAQSKTDGESGADPDGAYSLFGRLGVTPRLGVQVEVTRIEQKDSYDGVAVRTGTALLTVDLGRKGAFVPMLLVGAGVDRASDDYGGSENGTHIEGGFGLEYRADGGLTIGADVRMGGRSVDSDEKAVPLDALYYVAPMLDAGEYRSARITVGMRF